MAENRGPQLAGISAALGAMAFGIVLLRCYVRVHLVKAFGLDDCFMVAAAMTYVWYTVAVLCGIHYGTGRHMATLSTDDSLKALRFWWMCFVSYSASMILAKISIGLFLLRVAVAKVHRWIIYIVMVVTASTGIVFLFVTLFQCTPVEYFWTKVIPGAPGTCIDVEIIKILVYIYGGICAVCDFTFGLLPIAIVWNLSMDWRTKCMLVFILGMACIASCAVLIRMPYVKDFSDPDFLWATVDIAIWSTTESGLAITAGSLATLRPLYRRLLLHLSSSRSNPHNAPDGDIPSDTLPHHEPKRKRRSLFDLSNLTSHFTGRTTDTRSIDLEFNHAKSKARPYRLEDVESARSDIVTADTGARKEKKSAWRMRVRETPPDVRSESRWDLNITALPQLPDADEPVQQQQQPLH